MSCFIQTGRDCPTASSLTQWMCYYWSTVASTEPSGSTSTAALSPLRLSSTLSSLLPARLQPQLGSWEIFPEGALPCLFITEWPRSPHHSLPLTPHLSRHGGLAVKLTVTQLSKGMLEAGCISNRTLNSHPALAAGQRCQKTLRWLKSRLL